ncbi:MAG: DNA-processing protein DprA [Acinetobacter sp.]|nr:DNA-processing protein DprA [Acinetobacter sp.]
MLTHIAEHHLYRIRLWYLLQHSLSSYHKLVQYFGSAQAASEQKALLQWKSLGLHKSHVQRAEQFYSDGGQQQFQQMLNLLLQHCDFILCPDDSDYPAQLIPFDDCPPLIFGQGQLHALSQIQVAIVGSRKASTHGPQIAYDFAQYLSAKGFYITSGMAHGIDHAAHMGGLQHQKTIAVIGTGIDQVYPAQNKTLQQDILRQNGTIISEFLPTTPPLQHHFPRRNRIISALSLGTLVIEATSKSGSLSTARWAMEQGKTVFAVPGHIYSGFAEGCHQLIREGATLVDHPEQIVQDLAQASLWQQQGIHLTTPKVSVTPMPMPMPANPNNDHATPNTPAFTTPTVDVPADLLPLYEQLDWTGQSMDQLGMALTLSTADLTSQLMQLELLGVCLQQGGLYLKCR